MAKATKKAVPAKKSAPKKTAAPAKKQSAPRKAAAPAKKPTAKELAERVESLMTQAAIAAYANKLDDALASIEQARALATTKKTRAQIQLGCQTHGNQRLWNQKWKHALAFYDAGIAAFREGEDTRVVAEMLNESGFALLQLHRLDEAEQRIRRALELQEAAKRLEGVASAIYYLSSVVFERGNLDHAVELARQAVAKSVEGNHKSGEAFHSYALARALYEQGHTREAEEVARKAVPIAKSLGLGAVEGNLTNMIANVALDDHRLDEAEQQYERAIVLFEAAGLANHAAITGSNIGNLMWDRGRLDEALARYATAIKHHGKAKDDRSQAIALTARAGVYTELHRYDEAHRDLEAALAIMMRIGHERRVSFVRGAFARLAETRGELLEARAHYAEAEMSLEAAGDPIEIGRMLYASSGVEAELGDPEAALVLLQRAAALDPASLDPGATGKGEKRAGMEAVRVLRELALGRIEVARAKRATGDEARALRAAAKARLDAVVNAKDSLVHRSSEVRRVAGRLAAQLDAALPTARRYTGTCKGIGWNTTFTGDLFVAGTSEIAVTGTLDWGQRRTNVSVRGPATGDTHKLAGTLTEIGGESTVWHVRLELELRDKMLHGRFFEVFDEDAEEVTDEREMCAFKWRLA